MNEWPVPPKGFSIKHQRGAPPSFQEELVLVDDVTGNWVYWPVFRNPVRYTFQGAFGGEPNFPTAYHLREAVDRMLFLRTKQ
jgi:hypothetical protein